MSDPSPNDYQTLQTRNDLQSLEPFAELCKLINQAAMGVQDYLKLQSAELLISGCWANVGGYQASHKSHTHPNNYLSAVYYVEAPQGGNQIHFHDPRPQAAVMRPTIATLSENTADTAFISVSSGSLVLFPAWLAHSVPKNDSRERRMSISANLMFTSFAEKMSKPRWQGGH